MSRYFSPKSIYLTSKSRGILFCSVLKKASDVYKMLQLGDGVTCFSALFMLVLLGTRSAVCSIGLTAVLYLFLVVFRFPQVPASRARQVLRPGRLAPGGVSVVAHRAGAHDAPENTIAAIRAASANGATGVELDLEFTADGVAILMHDDTVDRTTNGSGPLSKLRFSEIGKLDAAAKHRLSDRFRGEKVPTLQEAVEESIKHQLIIYFDVKGHPDEAAAALKRLYVKHPMLYNSSVVCSFEPKVIYRMRQADPDVVTALTHRPWSLSHFGDGLPRFSSAWKQHWMQVLDVLLDWAHHHLLWKLCGVSAFLLQKNHISMDTVQYWAERGVEVVAWTVNTAVEKNYYQQQGFWIIQPQELRRRGGLGCSRCPSSIPKVFSGVGSESGLCAGHSSSSTPTLTHHHHHVFMICGSRMWGRRTYWCDGQCAQTFGHAVCL
ncbi:glycerophosphodiester phosphodiesterase 1 isoform X2 [Hemibagrus wyckioides]|uniref:glycerophosphodiester phosphodiesterase 1 isoform X2 n=1 Tax=Hemibagrus wyckioides TaxID=337641 RepID=UPI00266C58A5|nr:glycerophosphodiester phosphodiesterase 1 isoform X2 [Hemibagrus wyckioides]